MKRFIDKLIYTAFISFGLMTTGCADGFERFEGNESSGYLRFEFAISNVVTRGSDKINGEPKYHENSIHNLDLYFYDTDADDDAVSKLHIRESNINGSSTDISVSKLNDILNGEKKTFKIVAVANCSATNNSDNKSLNELKALTVKTPLFRGSGKADDGQEIEDFVMTNFDNILNEVEIDPNADRACTLTFRRVAAKIRVAIDVKEAITDASGVTWKPDLEDMRLFILNGVQTARLDGDIAKISPEDIDYYSIETTGSKYDPDRQGQLTESYKMSRVISEHTSTGSDGKITNDTYKYYNDIPLYTYPNRWEDAMFENTQTTLIVVIPWEVKDSSGDEVEVTYKPSYYSMPVTTTVDDDGYVNIVSNAYYYLRAYIGMMGSETPLNPLEVEMECEIADWGVAEETTADIRPLRFLQFNQRAFNVYNETEVSIPFYSSHNCSIIASSFKGTFYIYNGSNGEEVERTFNSNLRFNSTTDGTAFGKNNFYYYDIDNKNKKIIFSHDFFNIWSTANVSGNTVGRINGPYKSQNTSGEHKFYSRFEIEFTVRHTDLLSETATQYEETIFLTFYPAVYINIEKIDGSAYNSNDGWIFVNGYAYGANDATERNTGNLGRVGHSPDNDESSVMTTITLTQLDEDFKAKWAIGDPRTRHINNQLDDASMGSDLTDHLARWTNGNTYGGPYDGTATSGATGNGTLTNRHPAGSANICRTIWEEYPNTTLIIPWINGNITQWVAKDDKWSDVQYLEDGSTPNPQYHRTISYYYPTLETKDTENMVAPKFTMVSMHSYSADLMSKENARRRCAAYQQYGYPAGRWRLPTKAEIQYIKELQRRNILVNIFGGSNNWSAHGTVNRDGDYNNNSSSYVRCLYDTWYWEQLDEEGVSYNRIPDPDGSHANWKIFHWGDRPRENVLNKTGEPITVESFLEKHKGIKVVEK